MLYINIYIYIVYIVVVSLTLIKTTFFLYSIYIYIYVVVCVLTAYTIKGNANLDRFTRNVMFSHPLSLSTHYNPFVSIYCIQRRIKSRALRAHATPPPKKISIYKKHSNIPLPRPDPST